MDDDSLTKQIIGLAYKVHNTLGVGFLEKVYENALKIELEKAGLTVKQQTPIHGNYSGMSFRPKGEIPDTYVAHWGFLGLRPRNDIRSE